MASEVKTNKISPSTSTTVTLGDASDTFVIPASATLDVNGTIDVTGATTTGFPESDIVKIASGNLTGAGTISIDGHFSSTYLNYRIIFDSILTDTDDSDLNIRVNTSGSADTSSNYTYASARTYINSSNVSGVDSVKSGWNQDKWLFDDGLEDDNKPAVIDLMIYNPLSTAVTKVMMCDFWNLFSSGTQFNNHRVGMNWNLTTALTGVTIFLDKGSFETSTDTSKNNWTLYGYKN